MNRRFIILFLFVFLSIPSYAQHCSSPRSSYYVVLQRYLDNSFISIGLGAQTYLSEHYRAGNIKDHLSREININAGRFFSKDIFGLRLGFSRSTARGYNIPYSYYIIPSSNLGASNRMGFDYFNLHIDLLINFHSYFYRDNIDRMYNLVPYIGVGYFAVLKNGIDRSEPSLNGGLINQFKINDNFHIDIELKGVIIPSRIDGNSRKYVNIPASAIFSLRYKILDKSINNIYSRARF